MQPISGLVAGWIKANVDRSANSAEAGAGAGILPRDQEGNLLSAKGLSLASCTDSMAEVVTIKNGNKIC